MIGECHSNHVDENIVAKYKLMHSAVDRQIFVDFCLHTILYQPPSQGFVIMIIECKVAMLQKINNIIFFVERKS